MAPADRITALVQLGIPFDKAWMIGMDRALFDLLIRTLLALGG